MCPYCAPGGEIKAFGGYLHFLSIKHSVDSNVRSGYIKQTEGSGRTSAYECMMCGERWLLMPPDFPDAGCYRIVT